MRVLESIGVFQSVAENPVKAGVTKQNGPHEHQPLYREHVAQNIESHGKSFVVDQVICPGADAWIRQITSYAQVGSQEQERVPAPSVIQLCEKEQSQTKQKEFFEPEKVFHVDNPGDKVPQPVNK